MSLPSSQRLARKYVLVNISLALAVLFGVPAQAQQNTTVQPAQTTQVQHQYNIPAGPLGPALLQFGEQSGGIQLVAPLSLTASLRTPGLSGRYTAQEALGRLLAASGIGYRFYTPTSVTLFRIDDRQKQTTLGTVRVEGSAATGYGGLNGSTDVTATEGSGSYAAPKLGIGGKIAASGRETPQSVSVVTQTQMQDQKISTLTDALENSTGITIQTVDGKSRFYARGIEINRIQIDGGAPLDFSNDRRQRLSLDMALYDHVEILRGADGLFNGNTVGGGQDALGGGVINLVRKRPLDHQQITFESTVGSWNNFRNVLDLTGPLNTSGNLRGRLIAVTDSGNYFYDEATQNKKVLYGALETDLGSETQLRFGASHTNEHGSPFVNGLPRYATGDDLHLPRSFSTIMPWDRQNTITNEVFAQLDHRFNQNWAFNLNTTRTWQRENAFLTTLRGSADSNGDGLFLSSSQRNSETRQFAFDGSLNGSFTWWNLPQQIVFGGNYKTLQANGTLNEYSYIDPNINILNFMRSSLVQPELSWEDKNTPYEDKQWGAYSWINLSPVKDLYFKTGVRYNYNRSLYSSQESSFKESKFQKPYYALSYDLSRQWTIYGSYTDINQSQTSMITAAGVPLSPMTGSNKEIGIKFGSDKLTASLAAYRLVQKNASLVDYYDFDRLTGVSCCFLNDTATRISNGIELEVSGEITPGWQVAGGYTFNANKTRDDTSTSGRRFSTITPRHLFKLVSSYQFRDDSALHNWKIGGGVRTQSKSFFAGSACTDSNCSDLVDYAFTQGGYAIVSLFTSYRFNQNWTLSLNLDNLFDRRYYETNGGTTSGNYYGNPRNFKLALRGTFQ